MNPLKSVGFTDSDLYQLKIQSESSLSIIQKNEETVEKIISNGVAKTAIMQLALLDSGKLKAFIEEKPENQTAEKIVTFIGEARALHPEGPESEP